MKEKFNFLSRSLDKINVLWNCVQLRISHVFTDTNIVDNIKYKYILYYFILIL